MAAFCPTTALFPYTMARLDVLFESYDEAANPDQPMGDATYCGVTIRLLSDDQYESAHDPYELFNTMEPLATFESGDPVRDFADALRAARAVVGPDLGRVEIASGNTDSFVEQSRDFCWAESDEWPEDLTLGRINRTHESQAQARCLVSELTVPGVFDTRFRSLWCELDIATVEATYHGATCDAVDEIIQRLAKEAGMRVIAESQTSADSTRNFCWIHNCVVKAAWEPQPARVWKDVSDEERQRLAKGLLIRV